MYYALLILPSGYEKVFHDGAARIAAGNVLKTGLQPPLFWAWAVAYLEFYGMILLALGLLTRPVAFAFAIEMAVIAFMIQMPNGYFWTSRGAEFAIMLFVVCLAFVFGGGGRHSIDRQARARILELHSGLIFASAMTRPHFATSSASSARSDSGVPPAISIPCAASLARRSASCSTAFISRLRSTTISFGVPAGA